jgi:hypothetical protein
VAQPVRRVAWQPDRPFVGRVLAQTPREPLVLTNTLATRWRAAGRWSPGYLSRELGEEPLLTKLSSSYLFQYVNVELLPATRALLRSARPRPDNASPQPSPRRNLTMAQFWAAAAQQNTSGEYVLFAGETDASPALAALAAADLRGLRTWTAPPLSVSSGAGEEEEEEAAATAAVGGARGSVWQLWMGGGGVTSQPHYDQQHNIYAQLHGIKRFTLSPPAASARAGFLFPRLHACTRHSMADFLGWPTPPLTRSLPSLPEAARLDVHAPLAHSLPASARACPDVSAYRSALNSSFVRPSLTVADRPQRAVLCCAGLGGGIAAGGGPSPS